jgi:hypothetical protein
MSFFSLIVVPWLGSDRHIAMIGCRGRGDVFNGPYVQSFMFPNVACFFSQESPISDKEISACSRTPCWGDAIFRSPVAVRFLRLRHACMGGPPTFHRPSSRLQGSLLSLVWPWSCCDNLLACWTPPADGVPPLDQSSCVVRLFQSDESTGTQLNPTLSPVVPRE